MGVPPTCPHVSHVSHACPVSRPRGRLGRPMGVPPQWRCAAAARLRRRACIPHTPNDVAEARRAAYCRGYTAGMLPCRGKCGHRRRRRTANVDQWRRRSGLVALAGSAAATTLLRPTAPHAKVANLHSYYMAATSATWTKVSSWTEGRHVDEGLELDRGLCDHEHICRRRIRLADWRASRRQPDQRHGQPHMRARKPKPEPAASRARPEAPVGLSERRPSSIVHHRSIDRCRQHRSMLQHGCYAARRRINFCI